MSPDPNVDRGKSFEEGAAAYERLRPEFPESLFDDLVALAGGRMGDGVLEVGAGTGRATLPLARRGARIHVVEPSADMVRVLVDRLEAENLQDLVSIRQATFEDVEPGADRFGVVIAAQSFHWADPETRWRRLSQLLGEDGIAFLFWNGWRLDPEDHNLGAVREIYHQDGPDLVPDIEDHRSGASWAEQEIAADSQLTASATDYAWEWTIAVDDYLGLLATTSQYAVASPEKRASLFTSLKSALGQTVRLHGRTLLLSVRPGSGN